VGKRFSQVGPRSFGASIQVVKNRGRSVLAALFGPRVLGEEPPVGGDITRGLLILKEPLDKILAGTKTWEVRGKATALRGPIALIQSKLGQVVGTCEVIDVVGPLSLAELKRNARRTGFQPSQLPYLTTYAWVLRSAQRLPDPIPYRHPPGAVIWVRLEPRVVGRLKEVS
jgi:hypothetical protein